MLATSAYAAFDINRSL